MTAYIISPLLWEDKSAHRGPVVAIHRVREASLPMSSRDSFFTTTAPAHLIGAPPPPRPPRPREWVVSAGRGGKIRVWRVPVRWPAGYGAVNRPVGLEFCATLLTNSSIRSFSCALLCSANGDGDVDRNSLLDEHHDGRSGRGSVQRQRGDKIRLYCVTGSDNGFVQAWEMSLVGDEGVGGQPLWSQKVRVSLGDQRVTWCVATVTLTCWV